MFYSIQSPNLFISPSFSFFPIEFTITKHLNQKSPLPPYEEELVQEQVLKLKQYIILFVYFIIYYVLFIMYYVPDITY